MKQSSKKHELGTAALYCRLSRDDNMDSESNSIQNQRKILQKAAKDKGYTDTVFFVDDGITGTTMKRPGFQKMLTAIEAGYISAVFVKDLSRLGRNYIEVGKLTEEFFPLHDIRLVAVSDGVDSDEGEDDFTPFKNIMNEYYAKDISKKRRIVNKMKGNAGVPLSPPPYGYIKNPDDPRFWVVEPEAAEVVRRIYRMALEGYGLAETAAQLAADGVVNPTYYWRSRGTSRGGSKSTVEPSTQLRPGTGCSIRRYDTMKAYFYCRVAHDDSFSLEQQAAKLRRYAEQAGYTIVGVAAEHGSGLTLDRPALQELTEAVLAGKVDVVLVNSLDRLGRDWGMTKQYIDLLTEHKVKLLCLRERVSTDSSGFSPFST